MAKRKKFARISIFVTFSLLVSLIACTKPGNTAPTSMSQPDSLTNTVMEADLIVLGTISDLKYQVVTTYHGDNLTLKFPSTDNLTVVGRDAYTIFTLTVEQVIKGDPNTKEIFIKKDGGPLGNDVFQAPIPGNFYFSLSDRLLLSLKEGYDGIYTDFYLPARNEPIWIEGGMGGFLWIKGTATSAVDVNTMISRINQIMIENGIPLPSDSTNLLK